MENGKWKKVKMKTNKELAFDSVVLGVCQHKKAKVKTRRVKVNVETKTVKMLNGKSENENEQRACL